MQKSESKKRLQALSLDRHHQRALAYLARETGDPNMSGLIRRQIETQMRERFGPNWAQRLDEIEARELAAAS